MGVMQKMNKRLHTFPNLPLQVKISSIYILTNLFVCLVNLLLILGINRMSGEMEMVYRDNLNLNEMSESLDAVQSKDDRLSERQDQRFLRKILSQFTKLHETCGRTGRSGERCIL